MLDLNEQPTNPDIDRAWFIFRQFEREILPFNYETIYNWLIKRNHGPLGISLYRLSAQILALSRA